MRKTLVLAFMLSGFATAVYAQEAKTSTPVVTASADQDNKVKIDPASLPDAVKATLATDAYKDWTVATAWSVKTDPVYYAVELKKEDKTMTVNINADGKVR